MAEDDSEIATNGESPVRPPHPAEAAREGEAPPGGPAGPAMQRAWRERERARGRRDARRGAVILVILLALVGLVVYAALRQLGTGGALGDFTIADYQAQARDDRRPAPDFEEPALGGGTIASHAYAGKVLVVNFWASWCGPCRREAPAFQRLWEEYRTRGVQFLGVNFRDDEAAALAYEDEFGITYPSASDPSGGLAHEFRVVALPSTFVIGRDGWIAYHYTGIVTETLLRGSLEDALGGDS